MPLRSGLGAQLGIATETTYATFVPPATFFPFTSEGLTLEKSYVRSQGLRANRMFQAQDLHVGTTRTVSGPVVMELLTKGMGKWFNQLHGNTVTPVQQAATTAYLQTHDIGTSSPDGKSLSVQVGRPDTGGTVRAFSYRGCKVLGATINLESGGLSTVTWNLDGRDESTADALGSATYATNALPFNFTQGVVEVADVAIANVRSISIEISLPSATDRYHLGNAGVKDQPFTNAIAEVTANATLEFSSLTDHTRFTAETVAKLELNLTGSLIASTYYNSCNFTLNAAKQTSSGPTVDGPDILTTDVSFEGLDNGSTAPLSIQYQSTDTAL